jgi:hypothetical protein
VGLENQRFLEIMFFIRRRTYENGAALEFNVILNEDAVVTYAGVRTAPLSAKRGA